MFKSKQKGFTLIELLVVIAIIGLLSTLSILALNTARARARDAKRVADVKQIQTALEMYYNDAGSYPLTASVTGGASIAYGTNTYLRYIPTPPTPLDYTTGACAAQPNYTYATSATGYTLMYCLGAAVNNIAAGLHTATEAGIQ